MPKPELGTKRICPETDRKFYDLNRDPIVSPYTGQSHPLTYFEGGATVEEKEAIEPKTETAEAEPEAGNVEIVSLEDADEEAPDTGENIPDIGDDNGDTFLETDDDDDDVSGIINVSDDEEES